MPSDTEWAEKVSRLVKAELKRAGVTYEELAKRLTDSGMPESKASIASKLSRGGFSATFLLATLKAIGLQSLRVDEI